MMEKANGIDDGKLVVTASWGETVGIWDAATGQRLRTFEGHTHWVNCVAFSPFKVHDSLSEFTNLLFLLLKLHSLLFYLFVGNSLNRRSSKIKGHIYKIQLSLDLQSS